MKKFNTAPISGMQELLPALQAEFNRLKSAIFEVFLAHGFQNIETPTIDRTEILFAKAGGDTEKQIYRVVKTDECTDTADQALRFDHTVPLARYVVEHMSDLVFPFKVTQVGRNFRGERAQKGRFREFYQCDVDVIGWNTLSIAYDAEIIATLAEALSKLPLPNSFVVRISNRKLLVGLLENLNLEEKSKDIFNVIDHAEKVSPEETRSALQELQIGTANVDKLINFISINGKRNEVIDKLKSLRFSGEAFNQGINELNQVMQLLEDGYPTIKIVADTKIVRGLDYYTGTVFETNVIDYEWIGSICSGGRYENLAAHYTKQSLPGVGGSIGLTRLFYILQECNVALLEDVKPIDICVIPVSLSEYADSLIVANRLRQEGKLVDVVMTDKKLGDKMRYASRLANYAIIFGEKEAKEHSYRLRNLSTGEETVEKW